METGHGDNKLPVKAVIYFITRSFVSISLPSWVSHNVSLWYVVCLWIHPPRKGRAVDCVWICFLQAGDDEIINMSQKVVWLASCDNFHTRSYGPNSIHLAQSMDRFKFRWQLIMRWAFLYLEWSSLSACSGENHNNSPVRMDEYMNRWGTHFNSSSVRRHRFEWRLRPSSFTHFTRLINE